MDTIPGFAQAERDYLTPPDYDEDTLWTFDELPEAAKEEINCDWFTANSERVIQAAKLAATQPELSSAWLAELDQWREERAGKWSRDNQDAIQDAIRDEREGWKADAMEARYDR